MRLVDADAFDERVRAAGGMAEEELTEDFKDGVQAVLYMLSNQPTIQPEPHWISVTERLPKEEDSIFARYYGTDRWRKSMFRKKSREVIVTSVFEDGELHTEVAHTTDGEWHVGVNVVPRTVIAWMPLPEPYKGVTT